MPDVFDEAKRSAIMRAVRPSDTQPEMVVRRMLHGMGYRFRLHPRHLPGRPDIVLPRHRKVILVHGCFWHQHPACKRATRPQSNSGFWNEKLDKNVLRDVETIRGLTAAGWRVLVVWQCETRDKERLGRMLREFLSDESPSV
jgi:DNA mismatch endonuclease, patch repair protein